MPWKEVNPMDERVKFIGDSLRGGQSFSALCRRYGISRKTGYKWVHRYAEQGMEGLKEKTSRPKSMPLSIPYAIRAEVIRIRKGRPGYGAKKILAVLAQHHPQWILPSRSTVHNVLKREGLIEPRRRRRRVPLMAQPFSSVRNPNDLWSADFKGQFLTTRGQWCYPLTVMDHKSRYVFKVHGLKGTKSEPVKEEFKSIFRAYGMPWRIRTDNGSPFASRSVGGLSRLSKWWIRLGIVPERIEPGKPQQNGRHERMHRTLKDDACGGPQCSMGRLQERFEEFRIVYNEERPHESLGQLTPARVYQPSERVYPEKLPELEYPGHYRVLKATSVGLVYVNNLAVYVGHILSGEAVGLEQVDEDIWDVYFGALRLGGFSAKVINNKKDKGYRTLKV